MRICFLTAEYPPEVYWGGIGTYTHTTAQGLSELGHEVHVIAKTKQTARTEQQGSLHIHWIRDSRPRGLFFLRPLHISSEWMLYFSVRAERKLREIERNFGVIDVVEAPDSQAAGFWAALSGRYPIVTTLHNPGYSTRQYTHVDGHRLDFALRDYMERKQTRRSRGIVAPSAVMADKVARDWRIPRERIQIIPNPQPPLPATEDPSIYRAMLEGKRYMLFFGRLQTLKGVHAIAQALPAVFRRFPGMHMAFVGADLPYLDGTMKEYVMACCRGYESRLIFIDKLPKERLTPIVRGAELCVLPSLWECFANVVMESLGLGCITISSRNTGAEEIIEEGVSGLLVTPGDVQGLEKAILEALALPEQAAQKMREAALRRVKTFSLDKILPRKVEFFKTLHAMGGTQVKSCVVPQGSPYPIAGKVDGRSVRK